jgi:hypothetical protein
MVQGGLVYSLVTTHHGKCPRAISYPYFTCLLRVVTYDIVHQHKEGRLPDAPDQQNGQEQHQGKHRKNGE